MNNFKKVTIKLLISKKGFEDISILLSDKTKIGLKKHKGKIQRTGDLRYFGGENKIGTLHRTLFSGFIDESYLPRFKIFFENIIINKFSKKKLNDFVQKTNSLIFTNNNDFIACEYENKILEEMASDIEKLFSNMLNFRKVKVNNIDYTVFYDNQDNLAMFFRSGFYVNTNHISLNKKAQGKILSNLNYNDVELLKSKCPLSINLLHKSLEKNIEILTQKLTDKNMETLIFLTALLNK